MIAIIKKGTRQTQECPKCGCLFSYDREDIKLVEGWHQTFEEKIICPQCENEIALKAVR